MITEQSESNTSNPADGQTGPTTRKVWPSRLSQLHWRTWRGVLWRSVKGFVNDDCGDFAAALTYYAILALFPSAIVVVALVGLVSDGPSAIDTIIKLVDDIIPGSLVSNIEQPVADVVNKQGSAKVLLSFGLLAALWSASSYVSAFTRASNAIYGVQEGRPFYLLVPLELGLTVVALILLAVVSGGLVISGPVADALGDALHLGNAPRTAWNIGKWPLLVLLVGLLLSLLFWIAPNVKQPRFRWLTVGGAVALLVWILSSFGFGLYVANFSSYDRTYGSLGAVIAFLVWLYLSNCAIMLGVEINAELQRGRKIQSGEMIEPGSPALPPRMAAD